MTFPTPPAGWKIHARSRFQLALPDSWQAVRLEDQALRDAIASAQESNPPLAEQLRGLLESGQYQSFVFYAAETDRAPTAMTVSVARLTPGEKTDLAAFAEAYADALPTVVRGSKIVDVQVPLKVNGLDAASFVYDVTLVDASGNLKTLRGVQYLFLPASGDAYLVTVTGDAAAANQFMPLARQIAASFVGGTP